MVDGAVLVLDRDATTVRGLGEDVQASPQPWREVGRLAWPHHTRRHPVWPHDTTTPRARRTARPVTDVGYIRHGQTPYECLGSHRHRMCALDIMLCQTRDSPPDGRDSRSEGIKLLDNSHRRRPSMHFGLDRYGSLSWAMARSPASCASSAVRSAIADRSAVSAASAAARAVMACSCARSRSPKPMQSKATCASCPAIFSCRAASSRLICRLPYQVPL